MPHRKQNHYSQLKNLLQEKKKNPQKQANILHFIEVYFKNLNYLCTTMRGKWPIKLSEYIFLNYRKFQTQNRRV